MNSLQLLISSSNVDSKTDDSYIYYIPPCCIPSESQEHIYLSVQTAVIPNTFYNINKNNNTLCYSLDSNNIKQYLSLPLGNYNIKDIINFLNGNLPNFLITFDKMTNKLSFQNLSYLDFKFYPESNIYNVIGFNTGILYHSSGGLLNSRNVVNLNSIQYINIKANFSTNNLAKYNMNDKNIICSIPVNINPYGVINYKNDNNFRINTFTSQMSEIIIQFTDQNGNDIDFNGVQWSLVLQMDIINFVE